MENDIVVANKSVLKTLGATVLKSAAIAAGITLGVTLVSKVTDKSNDKS